MGGPNILLITIYNILHPVGAHGSGTIDPDSKSLSDPTHNLSHPPDCNRRREEFWGRDSIETCNIATRGLWVQFMLWR